jgi:plastocyanin
MPSLYSGNLGKRLAGAQRSGAMLDRSQSRRVFVAGTLPVLGLGMVAAIRGLSGTSEAAQSTDHDGHASPEASPVASPAVERVSVEIKRFEYLPYEVTIKPGTRVVWVNRDGAAHTVTADDGSFDSEAMQIGTRFGHTFDAPGRYNYFCFYHANMTGVVVVED